VSVSLFWRMWRRRRTQDVHVLIVALMLMVLSLAA
jgi:hypothetical protein